MAQIFMGQGDMQALRWVVQTNFFDETQRPAMWHQQPPSCHIGQNISMSGRESQFLPNASNRHDPPDSMPGNVFPSTPQHSFGNSAFNSTENMLKEVAMLCDLLPKKI